MPQNHEQENKEDNKENSPPLSSNEQLQIEKENGDKGNENNTEESTKEVESKHPYFRRCKLGIGEARLVETKLGSKKMEEEISYSCNYLKRLFKALNKTGLNFNNLELFQNRFHSLLENGRQNVIDCMTKYEKSLAKLKNKDGKDKFSNLLSSLTLPCLRVALKLKGKSDYGKKRGFN